VRFKFLSRRLGRIALSELYMRTENPSSLRSGRTKVTPTPSSVGFLLVDPSHKPIYANSEAIRILTFPAYPRNKKHVETLLAEKVRSVFLHGKRSSRPDFSTEFISGKRCYLCRAIGLQPNTALLLERKASKRLDASQVAKQYNLTPREQETVELLMQGLSGKEIANRMHISPNTMKTFLRLVMLKMGVSTRSKIIGKIIEQATRLTA